MRLWRATLKPSDWMEAMQHTTATGSIIPNFYVCRPFTNHYFIRAAAYIKLENYDKGTEDCKKAISLNPDYARAYGRLG